MNKLGLFVIVSIAALSVFACGPVDTTTTTSTTATTLSAYQEIAGNCWLSNEIEVTYHDYSSFDTYTTNTYNSPAESAKTMSFLLSSNVIVSNYSGGVLQAVETHKFVINDAAGAVTVYGSKIAFSAGYSTSTNDTFQYTLSGGQLNLVYLNSDTKTTTTTTTTTTVPVPVTTNLIYSAVYYSF